MGAWHYAAISCVLGAALFSTVTVAQSYRAGKTVFGGVCLLALLFWALSAALIFLKPVFVDPAPVTSFSDPSPKNVQEAAQNKGQTTVPKEEAKQGKVYEQTQEQTSASKEAAQKPGQMDSTILQGEPRWAKVTNPAGLKLMAEPNEKSNVLGGLRVNQIVVIVDDSSGGEWMKVRMVERGVDGWVLRSWILELPKEPKTQDKNINKNVETAKPGKPD